MRYLGGHLGIAVSALLDGQLDASSAERAWAHVQACDPCRRQVEREGWVKTRLASMTEQDADPPPAQLLGSLYGLGSADLPPSAPPSSGAAAWAAVHEIEHRSRARRRTGLAVAGAGSVSAAVLGLVTLAGSPLGAGGGSPALPTSALTRAPATGTPAVVAPVVRVHGTIPLVEPRGEVAASPTAMESGNGLRP